ncbi:putative malate dehydrogenase (decarboxylating) [Helianthus annuus]|nr:putative malate dehydrogenase (decarboxylating) [Helianthus annuus]
MWRTVALNVRRFCMAVLSTCSIPRPCIVHKRGADILHDPWFNKVCLFVDTEHVLVVNVAPCLHFERSAC